MRFTEVSLCLCLALVVHFGAWFWPSDGGVSSAGNGGDALVSLEASSPSLAALIEEWDNPIPVTDTNPIQPNLQPVSEPEIALTTPSPDVTTPAPKRLELSKPVLADLPKIPSIDMKPSSPPTPRKQVKVARQSAASIASPRQVAAGIGQQQAEGVRRLTDVSSKEVTQKAALMAKWGARIRRSIERRKRYPHGTKANGTTHVQLTVTLGGQLTDVRVRRPSGDGALDNAALEAVRRARLPQSPNGMPGQQHTFNLPITFSR